MKEEITVNCPECGAGFKLDFGIETGDILECPECEAGLEVETVEPIRLIAVSCDVLEDDLDEDDWDDSIWDENGFDDDGLEDDILPEDEEI